MKSLVSSVGGRWNQYWFRDAPLINLSICRILIVSFQSVWLWVYRSHLLAAGDFPRHLYDPLGIIYLLFSPFGPRNLLGETALSTLFAITVIAGIGALIGYHTRTSLGVFALGNIVLVGYAYSFGEIHHPEALMIIALVLLVMSPSGEVLTVDSNREGIGSSESGLRTSLRTEVEKQSEFASWPLLLIQVLFALIYFDAGISKIAESGADWMNGYTLQYYLGQDGLRWNSDLGVWLSEKHTLAKVMSVAALYFESTFFLVLLVPRLALLYLPLGIGMHVGIYLAMKAPFFQFLVLYSVFVPWARVISKLLRFDRSNLARLRSYFSQRRIAGKRKVRT